jgi:hypothetical protein
VPASGTLALDTIADDPSTTFWLLSAEDYFKDAIPNATHLSSHLDAGTTFAVLVLRPPNIAVGGGFTLKTTLGS